MREKRFVAIVAMILALGMLFGCSSKTTTTTTTTSTTTATATEAPAAEAAATTTSTKANPKNLVIASGNSGGTYYYIAAGQSKILTDKMPGYSITTESTSGSPVENCSFVQEDAGTFGIVTLDGLYAALQGDTDRGFANGALEKCSLVQVGHSLILYCVTLEGSGIETIADLKGKKISLPTVGNTAYFQAVAILEQYGITLNDCTATPMVYSEAGDALKDGTLDAIFVAGGVPQAAISDLDTTKDIRFLSIEQEKVASILEAYPYWGIQTLKAGTYADMKEDTNCMTSTVILIANNDLDDDVVYNVTKILNESVDELTAIHASGADWNVANTRTVMELGIVPVHAGAQRYYDEIAK